LHIGRTPRRRCHVVNQIIGSLVVLCWGIEAFFDVGEFRYPENKLRA
jgi:hypothetical protein